jgi:hypothetical protein
VVGETPAETPATKIEEEPEPEPESRQTYFADAQRMVQALSKNITPDVDLEEYRNNGRKMIDDFPHLTEEQRIHLRGQFQNIILTEQRFRQRKGRR